MMINLSYLPICMLYPKTGEYKTALFPPFILIISRESN